MSYSLIRATSSSQTKELMGLNLIMLLNKIEWSEKHMKFQNLARQSFQKPLRYARFNF